MGCRVGIYMGSGVLPCDGDSQERLGHRPCGEKWTTPSKLWENRPLFPGDLASIFPSKDSICDDKPSLST